MIAFFFHLENFFCPTQALLCLIFAVYTLTLSKCRALISPMLSLSVSTILALVSPWKSTGQFKVSCDNSAQLPQSRFEC